MYRSSVSTITQKPAVSHLYRPLNVVLNNGKSRLPAQVPNIPHIYSLSFIERKEVDEDEVGKITTFDTGISIEIPPHLNLQVIATPNLISHGYMLANGIAFVQSNTPLTVQLYKFREGPDLDLPYNGIYLMSQRINSVRYSRFDLPRAERNENYNFSPEFSSSPSSLPPTGGINNLS